MENNKIMKEIKTGIGILVFVLLVFFSGLIFRSKSGIGVRPVIEMYFSYINLWEYDRAYGLISSEFKNKFENISCFQPKSPWGNDWYNVMVTFSDSIKVVETTKKEKRVMTNSTLTHSDKRETAKVDIFLVLENNRWKVDSVFTHPQKKLIIDSIELMAHEKVLFDSLLKKGMGLYHEAKYWKAQNNLVKALKIKQNDAMLNAYLGLCYNTIASRSIYDIMKIINFGSNPGLYFETALELDSTLLVAYMGRGQSLLFAPAPYGNVDKAIKDFEYILKHDQKDMMARFFLGLAFKKSGNIKKAIRTFDDLLVFDPQFRPAKKELSYIRNE